jgi:hypothetical protein
MIIDRGDNTFNIRFVTATGTFRYVHIDAQLPIAAGDILKYAKLTPEGGLWVALVEKAYAYYRTNENTYASLNSGWMDPVYWAVTGIWSTSVTPPSLPDNQLGQFLFNNIQAGHAVSAGTTNIPPGPFIGSHAYTVHNAQLIDGVWYITVYNVWGYDGKLWDSDYSDGLLIVSLDIFCQNVIQIIVSLA